MTFVITPALIIGAYVERIKFSAGDFSSLALVVYAPVTHWVWARIMAGWGVMDFAGGSGSRSGTAHWLLLSWLASGAVPSSCAPHSLF